MFFFSRKTNAQPKVSKARKPKTNKAATVPEITAQIDFTLYTDTLTSKEIVNTLRRDLIEFSEAYNLSWAVTRLNVGTNNPDVVIPVQIKLTEDQDVVYTIDGQITFDLTSAAQWLDEVRAELIF